MTNRTKGLIITTLGVLFIIPDSLFVRLIDADILVITFWRCLLTGSFMLLGLYSYYGKDLINQSINIWFSGLIYAVCLGLSSVLFIMAIHLTNIANVLFIVATMPIFAAIFSYFLLNESISRRMLWTIAVVILGVAIIAFVTNHANDAPQNVPKNNLGNLIAVLVAALFALGLTAVRKQKNISMLPAIPIAYIGACLCIAPFINPLIINASNWWLILTHGGVFVLIGSIGLSIGPRYITSSEVALLLLLESVLVPLLAWFILDENLSAAVLIGGGLITLSLLISNVIAFRQNNY